jgi:hypothetical protein
VAQTVRWLGSQLLGAAKLRRTHPGTPGRLGRINNCGLYRQCDHDDELGKARWTTYWSWYAYVRTLSVLPPSLSTCAPHDICTDVFPRGGCRRGGNPRPGGMWTDRGLRLRSRVNGRYTRFQLGRRTVISCPVLCGEACELLAIHNQVQPGRKIAAPKTPGVHPRCRVCSTMCHNPSAGCCCNSDSSTGSSAPP